MKPSEIIRRFAKMTIFSRGNNEWMFIDVYNQLWKIKYTGSRSCPFEISLIEQDYLPPIEK